MKSVAIMVIEPTRRFASIQGDLLDQNGRVLECTYQGSPLFVTGTVDHEQRPVADIPFMIHSPYQVFSERLVGILVNYRVCPSIRWAEARIARPSGRSVGRGFIVAVNPKQYDIWDYVLSDCAWLETRKRGTREAVAYMRRGVAAQEKMPNLDLFFAEQREWVVSAELAAAMSACGIEGAEFSELLVVGK